VKEAAILGLGARLLARCWIIGRLLACRGIKAKSEATCNAEGSDPKEKLIEFLGALGNLEAFWGKAKTNLQAGKVRMLFLADKI